MGFIQRHLKEIKDTIKLSDIEEAYDVYFSRFFGLFFAKIGRSLGLHPNHISISSLLVGITGGALLFFQDRFLIILLAGVLITISGVLDSADGQLARMTGKSSEIGRIIDGVIDTLVFMTCYLYGTLYFFFDIGWPVVILSVISLYSFGLKTSLYDFYKSEYIRLILSTKEGHIPMAISEIKRMGNKPYHYFLHFMNTLFASGQIAFSTRSRHVRERMTTLSNQYREEFEEVYRKLNKPLMPIWAWVCGLNVYRNGIIIFSLFGRFDLYLIVSLILTIFLIPLWIYQRDQDKKLLAYFD